MVEKAKVLIGVSTGEYARRADFYDYFNMLQKPDSSLILFSHDRSPAHSRNTIAQTALEHECTHVLYIDDDMAYKPQALNQLLEHDKDVVTGLYYGRAYPHQPLIFDLAEDDGKCLYAYLEENEPRLKPIVNCGLGFVLIKTDIFRRLEQPWVRLGEPDPQEWCDDIGFFNRVRGAGFEIFCDTECLIGHIGTMIVWPVYQDGKWMTGYDTGGKGMISTPQIEPGVEYTIQQV